MWFCLHGFSGGCPDLLTLATTGSVWNSIAEVRCPCYQREIAYHTLILPRVSVFCIAAVSSATWLSVTNTCGVLSRKPEITSPASKVSAAPKELRGIFPSYVNAHQEKTASVKLAADDAAPSSTETSKKQQVWVEPLSKEALTAAVEAGCTSFVFRDRQVAQEWSSLAMFTPMFVQEDSLVAAGADSIAKWAKIANVEEQQQIMQLAGLENMVVLDAVDWKIIPAENLIAAFQVGACAILSCVCSFMDPCCTRHSFS